MYDNKQKQPQGPVSPQGGFIALMSAIIISAVLITTIVTGSLSGFYTRFNILDSELKKRSAALAEACADIVLYKLSEDYGYAGPDMNYVVGGDTCNIFAATNPSGSPREFKVQGMYQNSYTNLRVVVDVDALAVISWQEVAN